MNEEAENLIEQARRTGQAYIDSFGGDLKAVLADLDRRAVAEGRATANRPPNPPHPWQLPRITKAG